jgi:hypothetical protein
VASSRTRGPGWAVPVFFGFLSWSRWSCGFLSTAGRGPASGQGSAVAWWLGRDMGQEPECAVRPGMRVAWMAQCWRPEAMRTSHKL